MWSWKDSDQALNPSLNLLYEPGNWGDVLKGLWAVELVPLLKDKQTVRVLDPYSGALDYPCTDATRKRLGGAALGSFRRWQRDYLRRGRLASTGRLIQEACRHHATAWHTVICEIDQDRRDSWRGQADYDSRTPAELLARAGREFDFVCWDPYDFFEQWSHTLPALLEAARQIPVLIYLYNKSPRGVNQMRNYEQLRRRIPGDALYGRVPSDGLLPRAYHETILLAPVGILDQIEHSLKNVTRKLYLHIGQFGCFERQV